MNLILEQWRRFLSEGVTGDNKDVGLFIRLPKDLAKQFPYKKEDPSPPHVTLLIVGDITGKEDSFDECITKVFKNIEFPFKAKLNGLNYFENKEDDLHIAHCKVKFEGCDLAKYRSNLVKELQDKGFKVADRHINNYSPHTTLAYLEGLDTEYEGDIPEGEWEVDAIEIWGLSELKKIE